jgi:hypothetical protein
MNAGPYAPLLAELDLNWRARAPDFAVALAGLELEVAYNHPLASPLAALCAGRPASMPFFTHDEAVWCTLAPDGDSLREAVASLHAWILPSFGGEGGDGFVPPATAIGPLAAAIIAVSPSGYYRWRCPRREVGRICAKFRLRHRLEAARPERTRPPRPSLYELRARFGAALLVGDREGAEEIIQLLDSLQLETAVNTQFMRIRMWHHFREDERIRTHPDLPHLLAQPLPPHVHAWIDGALAPARTEAPEELIAPAPPVEIAPPAPPAPEVAPVAFVAPAERTWADWFELLRNGERAAAELFLSEHRRQSPDELAPAQVGALVAGLEELFLDDTLRQREWDVIAPGISEFLEEFVREPEFPRSTFGDLYLALLRLWSALHAGTSSGQQHGHVLLELAHAALRLNRAPGDVLQTVEHWWHARPSRGQLPFALDAIELLEREYPEPAAPMNLWFAAADLVQRNPDTLVPSEKALWRRVGQRLGIEDRDIEVYLAAEEETGEEPPDPLATASLQHVAIVCMREPQAREAAGQIRARTAAQVTLVTGKSAGAETDLARTANVVLFVWLATSHAVFRAFDGIDRKRISYVQGTGAASIVRSLERWLASQ